MDGQLRDLLDAAVGDPPRQVTVAAVRRRMARRRVVKGVAAATAAVLLTGLGVAVSAGGRARPPAGGAYSRAGVPGHYVQQEIERGSFWYCRGAGHRHGSGDGHGALPLAARASIEAVKIAAGR